MNVKWLEYGSYKKSPYLCVLLNKKCPFFTHGRMKKGVDCPVRQKFCMLVTTVLHVFPTFFALPDQTDDKHDRGAGRGPSQIELWLKKGAHFAAGPGLAASARASSRGGEGSAGAQGATCPSDETYRVPVRAFGAAGSFKRTANSSGKRS